VPAAGDAVVTLSGVEMSTAANKPPLAAGQHIRPAPLAPAARHTAHCGPWACLRGGVPGSAGVQC